MPAGKSTVPAASSHLSPFASITGTICTPQKNLRKTYMPNIQPTELGEYDASWWVLRYPWKVPTVFTRPKEATMPLKDASTTSQACRSPSGQAIPSSRWGIAGTAMEWFEEGLDKVERLRSEPLITSTSLSFSSRYSSETLSLLWPCRRVCMEAWWGTSYPSLFRSWAPFRLELLLLLFFVSESNVRSGFFVLKRLQPS